MKTAAPPAPFVGTPASPAAFAWLDYLLFALLLALLCGRAMCGETFERLELSFVSALAPTGGPTPATTAALDTLLLAVAGVALARVAPRWWGARGPTRGVILGLGLLVAGVCLSSLLAADRGAAWLAGSSLAVGALAAAALAALTRTRWMAQILLAAWLATGATTAIKCLVQYRVELPDLVQEWRTELKPQLLARGYDGDDPLIINYERRLESMEPYGFLAHPNITGSCLALWLVAGAGLTAALLSASRRFGPSAGTIVAQVGLMLVLLVATGGALWLTGSLGAVVAAAGGLFVLALLATARRAAAVRRYVAVLVVVYVGAIGGVTALGVARGTLPHASLAFRWHYWTAAARAWQDVPLTGLGAGNFGAAYMRYRSPESTEEVKNPHNVWLSLLVETGPLALLGALVLLTATGRAALAQLAACSPAQEQAVAAPEASAVEAPWFVPTAAACAAGVLIVQAITSTTLSGNSALFVLWLVDIALTWCVSFGALLWLAGAAAPVPRWLALGAIAAIAAALIHGLVDFALVTPGGLAMFGVLAAYAARCAATDEGAVPALPKQLPAKPVLSWVALAVVALLVVAHGLGVTRPEWRTSRALQQLSAALQHPPASPDLLAREVVGLAQGCASGDLQRGAAQALLQLGRTPQIPAERRSVYLNEAEQCVRRALQQDAESARLYGLLADIIATQAALASDAERPALQRRAAEAFDTATRHYPTDPRLRIDAGAAWRTVWETSRAPADAEHAAAHYSAALEIDDCRPPEEVQRLRAEQRKAAEKALAQLRESVTPGVPTTGPHP